MVRRSAEQRSGVFPDNVDEACTFERRGARKSFRFQERFDPNADKTTMAKDTAA